jgi:hypothetical protein
LIPSPPLLELLRAELPGGAERRLLLVPPALADWAESHGARALGARPAVVAGAEDLGAALAGEGGEGGWHAVVSLFAGDAPAGTGASGGELAAAFRRGLREGGRALVATGLATVEPGGAGEPPPYEGLVAALAENRLLIRRELRPDGSALPWDGHRRSGAPGGPTVVVAEAHGLTVRGYRAGDEQALVELFRRSFDAERSLAHWRWRYQDHPHGRHRISLAVDPAGRPLAQYAAYPALWWDGRERRHLRAHQIGDIMSAPEARGRGRGRTSVLAQAARHFYAAHCWGRVDFDYGFHTAASRGFSNRFLAVVDPEPVPFRAARPEGFAPAAVRGYRVRPLAAAGPELDGLWRRARGDYGRLAVRDRRYLEWRYFRRPDVRYLVLGVFRWRRLVGWSVFCRRDGVLAWVDALFRRRAAPAASLTVAAAVERLGGGSRVVAWFPPRPAWWHRELESLGFARETEPDGLDLGIVCFSEPTDPEGFRRDLYYTMGDSDLV